MVDIKMNEWFYVREDDNSEYWGIYGEDSDECYESGFSSEKEANERLKVIHGSQRSVKVL